MECIQQIKKVLSSHPVRIIEPGGRARASVALIVAAHSSELKLLLIERATDANDHWSGQIGLPGGRSEPGDKTPRHTAERETREELGLDLSTARFLGRLGDIAPGGLKIVVSCFVYAVQYHPVLCPDRSEIADAFWFPVRGLNDPARISVMEITYRNRPKRFPALKVSDDKTELLWGITYRLLRDFNRVLHRHR